MADRRRVVLWGGRPGRDLWVGSPADQSRSLYLNLLAERRRYRAEMLVRIGPAAARFVASAEQAVQAFGRALAPTMRVLETLGAAENARARLRRAGLTTDEANERIRTAIAASRATAEPAARTLERLRP